MESKPNEEKTNYYFIIRARQQLWEFRAKELRKNAKFAYYAIILFLLLIIL